MAEHHYSGPERRKRREPPVRERRVPKLPNPDDVVREIIDEHHDSDPGKIRTVAPSRRGKR